MIEMLIKYDYLRYAVISAAVASVVCGIMGVIIIEKKIVMMSGGIAHTAYGGVGLGYLLGFEPILGAAGFAVLASLGIGYVRKKGKASGDVMTALFWSLGMALGILFIGFTPGYPPDMTSYLFGSILAVTKNDLIIMCVISAFVILLFIMFYNDWKAYLFDSEFSRIRGLSTGFFDVLLPILIALTVVVLIRVAGIILVIALLTAPAATAGKISHKFGVRILLAILFGLFYCFSGLYLSDLLGISSGATIVIVSVGVFLAVSIISSLVSKIKRKKSVLK